METRLLKATSEPMLMRFRRSEIVVVKTTVYVGIAVRVVTYNH